MARRFRGARLLLLPAIVFCAAAFAQQAPLDLQPAAAAQKSAKPLKTDAPAPIPAAEAVERANAWLDAARVMTADFVQIGPNGRRSEGQLSLVRPGHMRFEYTDPPRFEIVADGRSVAIIDRKLNTQDEYFIGQTPLKFLLSDHIDMARDTRSPGRRPGGQRGHDRGRGSGGARGYGASYARLRCFDLCVEAMDGNRRARLPDCRHSVQCRSEDRARPGALPHRRGASQSAWQPQALTAAGPWTSARTPLRLSPRLGM